MLNEIERQRIEKKSCHHCSHYCERVGEINRFIEVKEECCNCYVQSEHKEKNNPNFDSEDFCKECVGWATY